MTPTLTKSHQGTYDAIFRHPIAHDLSWRDIRSMLGEIGAIEEQSNGHFKTTCNGETVTLHPTNDKDVTDEHVLMEIRKFLLRASGEKSGAAGGLHLLVVIDHREARIFKTETRGEAPQSVVPFDPHGYGRTLHNNEDHADGQRKPEQRSFYDAVCKTLEGADKILLFGTGTGASSAMEHLLAELKSHHRELAERVIGSMVVDQHHQTDDQLLAKARGLFDGK